MANDHKHSPWRKTVLIPFWCLQLFFMLLFIALLGLAEGVLASYSNIEDNYATDQEFDEIDNPDHAVHIARNIIVPVWIALCVVCLILTITEIILLARHKLRPLAFLIMNLIKTTIWTALFVLDIVNVASGAGRTTSIFGLIIDSILLLSFWIPFVYGCVIFHRFRKEKSSYKPVEHPYALPIDTHDEYSSRVPAAYGVPQASQNVFRDVESSAAVERTRSQSFNHERDTRYEAYRISSSSPRQTELPTMATFENRGLVLGGDGIPSVYVDHHDGDAIEMDSRRSLR